MRRRAYLLLGAILLLGVGVASVREFMTRYAVSGEIKKLEASVKELEERKTSLLATLEYFQSPLFQEQEAREKLGLTKPGENVVIVPEATAQATNKNALTADQPTETSGANPVRWWQFFFGA